MSLRVSIDQDNSQLARSVFQSLYDAIAKALDVFPSSSEWSPRIVRANSCEGCCYRLANCFQQSIHRLIIEADQGVIHLGPPSQINPSFLARSQTYTNVHYLALGPWDDPRQRNIGIMEEIEPSCITKIFCMCCKRSDHYSEGDDEVLDNPSNLSEEQVSFVIDDDRSFEIIVSQ
jgi:hypothetical protein